MPARQAGARADDRSVAGAGRIARAARARIAGQSIGITLDREIFVERGDVISAATRPAKSRRAAAGARVLAARHAARSRRPRSRCASARPRARGTVTADRATRSIPGKLAADGADGHRAQTTSARSRSRWRSRSRPIAYAVNPAHRPRRARVRRPDRRRRPRALGATGRHRHRREPVARPRRRLPARSLGVDAAAQARAATLRAVRRCGGSASRICAARSTADRLHHQLRAGGSGHHASARRARRRRRDRDARYRPAVSRDLRRCGRETERRYGRRIRAFYPRHDDLEALVERQGINGFYESREARAACCHVRKVEPLNRALDGRAAGSPACAPSSPRTATTWRWSPSMPERGLIKLNPLFDWTREQLLAFAQPTTFRSIRCTGRASPRSAARPARAPIAPGEPERAGRWWWEEEDKKECGLHARRPSHV